DTTRRWDSLVVVLGREDPAAASSLVDRVRRLPNRPREQQARLLLEDGLRLVQTDSANAARRFYEVVSAGATGEAAGRASLELLRLNLRRVSQPQDLVALMEALKAMATRFETVSGEITGLGRTIAKVHAAAAAVTPDSAQGDLRLFLAAETARDTLAAPGLAEGIFRRIPEQWPTSPYAPKAILAAQQLNPGWVDSARALLEERYIDSPYLAIIRGDATAEYRALEDSLGAFAASFSRPPPSEIHRRPPARRDAGEPARRPRPATGGSRVPEPQ
ncbi:MAG TPA: hypothetical protein VGJ36_03615, partial [Gemmatimonadales bacterium]